MQQKRQTVGGTSGQQVNPELLQDALFGVLKLTAQSSVEALGTVSSLQQRRAERLNLTAKALRKNLGDEHPDVLAVEAMAKSAGDLKVEIGNQTKRAKNFPKLRPYEWIVFGNVRDQSGLPASDLVVRAFDRDRKYDDLLGETETDAHGDFSMVYHERDFKETNENQPELYVMVSDAKGNLLYTSRDNVRFNAGQSEYFAIRLGEKRDVPAPQKETKRTVKPKSAKS